MREKNQLVEQAAEYLNGIPKFSREKHTMEGLRTMLRILGAYPEKEKILHVAGTNGKGSVCAFLTSILREAGYHTAAFTSPHLLSVKERFSFDGQEVEDAIFLEAFSRVKQAVAEFEKAGVGHPTYFEALFLMYMWMLRRYPVDYVILETGLGGRLDATNCIRRPALSVITSVSLDHMEYLGNTVAAIAGEKAGIIKKGVPVFYDSTSIEASAVIQARAEALHSPSLGVGRDSYRLLSRENNQLTLVPCRSSSSEEAGALTIPFPAEYQAVNAMLAFHAAEYLDIPQPVIARGIRHTVWPGRMERLREGVYIDGAHNEGAIRELARSVRQLAPTGAGRRIFLFAVVSDKDYREMAELLFRECEPDILILTRIQYSRGLDLRKLEAAVREAGASGKVRQPEIRVIPTVKAALQEAFAEKREEDTVFCAGSLYLVGEIKEVLEEETCHE